LRHLFYNIAALLIIAVALWLAASRDHPAISGTLHAIDGDSLRGPGGDVRLYGIDAPELRQTCLNGRFEPYPCGRESFRHLELLMADKPVTCRVIDHDRYRRTVAVCVAGTVELNQRMVEDGWAIAYERLPSVYSASEERARNIRRGLWQGQFQNPKAWRDSEARGNRQ
jgi:endonuclease YncB( thermonuclease family)